MHALFVFQISHKSCSNFASPRINQPDSTSLITFILVNCRFLKEYLVSYTVLNSISKDEEVDSFLDFAYSMYLHNRRHRGKRSSHISKGKRWQRFTFLIDISVLKKYWNSFFVLVLALFSIVSFKNQGCRSNSGNRNGTCYTSSECLNKGGDANGGCAAG